MKYVPCRYITHLKCYDYLNLEINTVKKFHITRAKVTVTHQQSSASFDFCITPSAVVPTPTMLPSTKSLIGCLPKNSTMDGLHCGWRSSLVTFLFHKILRNGYCPFYKFKLPFLYEHIDCGKGNHC